MAQTAIEWTDAVWNPVTGCSKVSAGCRFCYAERMAQRFAGMNGYPADDPFRVTLHPERLDMPLRWEKPRRIFVNSMSDLFHEDVPVSFIIDVFEQMWWAPQHTFQVLTKRPERMRDLMPAIEVALRQLEGDLELEDDPTPPAWPLPNVWLGVSVEDQQAADERIPLLLQTPAAARFISAEPLLGPVDLSRWLPIRVRSYGPPGWEDMREHGWRPSALHWVIGGGESGPGARPMHPDWARSLRDQCKAAGVPFLFKQWGEYCHPSQMPPETDGSGSFVDDLIRVGKKAAGRLLDGRIWDEYPEVR